MYKYIMIMKKYFIQPIAALLIVAISFVAKAEIPSGYYTSLNGKTEASLKTAAYNIIRNFTKVSSYSDLPKYFQKTDVYPDGKRWWEMYSNQTFYLPNFTGMNREHALPKSWWGGSSSLSAYVDLNHLYPSEMDANSAKSNYPLGEVQTTTFDNGVSKVGYAVSGQGGGASKVFEPADEYKGDFARSYFYMVTCYQDVTWKYTYMIQQGTYPTLNSWSQELLLKWHREDPVSQKELDRNEQVYLIQNNRNPFIDYPSLAEYIWGNKKGELFYTNTQDNPSGTPNLISPAQGSTLEMGQVAMGTTTTKSLYFKGESLTGSLTLTLSGTDKSMFGISTESIKATLVNSDNGYWLTVTYSPTSIGTHSAKILISDGGISGSRGITLTGECLEIPTLTTLTALPASDITEDSYVANWEAANEPIDYYIVTRTQYIGGETFVEEIEVEDNSLEITGFSNSEVESYSVQSVKLDYRSEMSNVIFVEHAGISNIETDKPLTAISYSGYIRFICSTPHYNINIYDITGRIIKTIAVVENDMEISLPNGAYFIASPQQKRPIKIIVK